MLPLASATPTTAERIRSACVRAGSALLLGPRKGPRKGLRRGRAGSGGRRPGGHPDPPLAARRIVRRGVPVDTPRPTTGFRRASAARAHRLRAASGAGTGPLPGVGPRSAAASPCFAVTQTLDLIAAENPSPALLQVRDPEVQTGRRRRDPVHPDAARGRVRGRHRRDRGRAGQSDGPTPSPARPILRDRIHLALAPGHRPQRRRRAAGVPAAGAAATRPGAPAGSRPVRRALSHRRHRRRSRHPAALPQAGGRHDRVEPGHPGADGLPVPATGCARATDALAAPDCGFRHVRYPGGR